MAHGGRGDHWGTRCSASGAWYRLRGNSTSGRTEQRQRRWLPTHVTGHVAGRDMLLIVFLHSHLGERVVRAGTRCGGLPWGWWHRLLVRPRPKRGVIWQAANCPRSSWSEICHVGPCTKFSTWMYCPLLQQGVLRHLEAFASSNKTSTGSLTGSLPPFLPWERMGQRCSSRLPLCRPLPFFPPLSAGFGLLTGRACRLPSPFPWRSRSAR